VHKLSESQGQKKLADRLTADGWLVTKIQSTNRPGFPDLLCLKASCPPLLIECKAAKGRRTERQKLVGDQLTKAGCDVRLMDVSVDPAVEIFDAPIWRHEGLGF
jgi:Holliday junction resolvase